MKNKIHFRLRPGINIDSLRGELADIKVWGFNGAELSIDTVPLIISGRVNQSFVDYVQPVLKEYDLSYSAHIGLGLDLRVKHNLQIHIDTLYSSIDICSRLNLNPLVLHFEQDSGDKEIENEFIRHHAEAAAYAEERNVALVLENVEIEHYKPVINAIKQINHPNLAMNLDVGHLYLAAKYLGFSFEDAVMDCIPHVRHCHLHDNTGIFEPMRLENFDLYETLSRSERIAHGRGDIHLPPLYGDVPIPFVVDELKRAGYSGIYTCEYSGKMFAPFNTEICNSVRALIEA